MEERPTEVHAKMKKLNFNKFMRIIRENITPSTERKGLLEPLIEYAIKVAQSKTDKSFFKKTGELVEINRMIKSIIPNYGSEGEKAAKDVIAFVMEQPDEFKKIYISNFTYDCMNAFPDAVGNARISCPPGQYERIYLNMEGVLESYCLGNESCSPLYKELYSCFIFTIEDMNNLALEWFKETQNLDKDNFNNMSSEELHKYIDSKALEFKEFAVKRVGKRPIIDDYIAKQFKSLYGLIGGKKKRKTKRRRIIKKQKTVKRRKIIQKKKK